MAPPSQSKLSSAFNRKSGSRRWSVDSGDSIDYERSGTSKKVSFSHLFVAEFSVRPCVNPGCSNAGEGPAIMLHNEVRSRGPLNLDLYEFSRKPLRKFDDELRMSPYEREDRLKQHGYSRSEMELEVEMEKKTWEKAAAASGKSNKIVKFFKSDCSKRSNGGKDRDQEKDIKTISQKSEIHSRLIRRASSGANSVLSDDTKETEISSSLRRMKSIPSA
jgi:hypothetical protein